MMLRPSPRTEIVSLAGSSPSTAAGSARSSRPCGSGTAAFTWGGQERNWECFTEVRIHYIPKPPVQLTDADEPILVHRARALYVAYLAWRMATRGPKEIQGSLGDMRGHYLELEQRLVDEFTGRHHVHERVRVTY